MTKEQRLKRKKELNERIRRTPMTSEEEEALRRWVATGNSVYNNQEAADTDENGSPRCFMDYFQGMEDYQSKAYHPGFDDDTLDYFMEEYPKFTTIDEELEYLHSAKACLKREILTLLEFLEEHDLRTAYYQYKEELDSCDLLMD